MGSKKIVLAIDDNQMQLDMFHKILDSRYDVRTADCASSAMRFLSLNEDKADIVLLDITMPHISGFEFLNDIKSIPSYLDIPIIIVSGNTGEDFLNEAKNSSAVDFLAKPVNPEKLIASIEKALKS